MTPPATTDSNETTPNRGRDAAEQRLFNLVAAQPFFRGLNARHLQLLTDSAMEIQFEAGQSIFQEDTPANRFYLILEGQVVLETELDERGIFPIQTLGPGDDLGWAWLFPPYLLHLSARALVPTRTIFFYGTRLREQCEQDHDLGYELMQREAAVVIQSLQSTQQRLVECLSTNKPSQLPAL
jgi:CRP-like cAMP-binding protein